MEKALAHIKIILLAVILPVSALNAQTSTIGQPVEKHRITKSYAIDTILGLPEIREDDAYIRKATKGKRHLLGMIYSRPDSQRPYYWVAIVEDNGMSFVPHFFFYVFLNGRKIKYYDIVKDTAVDLSVWRRRYHRK